MQLTSIIIPIRSRVYNLQRTTYVLLLIEIPFDDDDAAIEPVPYDRRDETCNEHDAEQRCGNDQFVITLFAMPSGQQMVNGAGGTLRIGLCTKLQADRIEFALQGFEFHPFVRCCERDEHAVSVSTDAHALEVLELRLAVVPRQHDGILGVLETHQLEVAVGEENHRAPRGMPRRTRSVCRERSI